MISVLILTLDEEINLPACLESVRWSDDIVILDSGSTDRTLEIARKAGARIIHRKFDDERNQRTFSLNSISFKYPWVYNPDADEITPSALRDEMLAAVSDTTAKAVTYRVRFKTMFMGKWLRHCSLYPTWVVRLFRPESVKFERTTNLTYRIDGPEGRLKEHFLHFTFRKGLHSWFEKHNTYSTFEAAETLKSLGQGYRYGADLFSGEVSRRRRAMKELSFRLPMRPMLRFLYMYVFRMGFLDGIAGFTYCRLLSIYEYMIVVKVAELQRREAGKTI